MKLLYNAKISTLNHENDEFSAIGWENGRIVFLGSDEEGLALNPEESYDLNGKRVLPGFTDSHMHLLHYSFFSLNPMLFGEKSIESIKATVKATIDERKPAYIVGMGWNQEYLDEKKNALQT